MLAQRYAASAARCLAPWSMPTCVRPSEVTTLDAIGLLGTDPDGSLRQAGNVVAMFQAARRYGQYPLEPPGRLH